MMCDTAEYVEYVYDWGWTDCGSCRSAAEVYALVGYRDIEP